MELSVRLQNNSELATSFVRFVCEQLNIEPQRISLIGCKLDGNLGLCIDESDTDFLVLVQEEDRNITSVFVTIAHELVHVKQYMKENLGHLLDSCTHIPYLERWWEKEAQEKSVELVKKYAGMIAESRNRV
jgi:hypothetical protein